MSHKTAHKIEAINTIIEAMELYGPDRLDAYKSLGNIRVVRHATEPYLLFNYTEKAMHEDTWNEVERIARGLIMDYETGEVVALPFEKFFNLEQRRETSLLYLPEGPCEITSKLDGSLGILYWTSEGPAIATRGSFTSEQAIWATQFLNRKFPDSSMFKLYFPKNITLLFEVIYPENRVVLDYGPDMAGLFLIGARDTVNGTDFNYQTLLEYGELYDFPVTPQHQGSNIHDLIPLAKSQRGIEGWVVRFDNGLRVKLKTEEYLHLHRLISRISPGHIRDLLLQEGEWHSFLNALPDEFSLQANQLARTMMTIVALRFTGLSKAFQEIKHFALSSRKSYAQEVMSKYREDSGYLFALLDGKDIITPLLKNLELDNLRQEEKKAYAALLAPAV